MDSVLHRRRSDALSAVIVGMHLVVVLAPVYVSAVTTPGPLTVVLWVACGCSMNGIVNLLHECAHFLVFSIKHLSDAFGRYIVAPLLLIDFDAYRDRHWRHHLHLGVEGETKDTYLIDIRKSHILALFLRCATGVEVLKKFRKQLRHEGDEERVVRDPYWMIRTTMFHALFFLSLLAAALLRDSSGALLRAIIAYSVVYVYGTVVWTTFLADLRSIAEHQLMEHDDSASAGHAALRNFKCNMLTRFLMGSYGFGEHYTHHAMPSIPYYRLPVATAQLAANKPDFSAKKGYFRTLLDIVSR